MEERYIECKFYYWILRLFNKFNYSIVCLDIIEAYCNIADIDSTIIKSLIKQIREDSSQIATYKEEIVYIARKLDISYRTLAHDTGISTATQGRIMTKLVDRQHLYEGLTRRSPDYIFTQIYKFVKIVDVIKEL